MKAPADVFEWSLLKKKDITLDAKELSVPDRLKRFSFAEKEPRQRFFDF